MVYSRHASYRRAQRNISPQVVKAVVAHGRLIRGRQSEAYFLGEREVRQASRDGFDLVFARNTQVIMDHDGLIITLYRTDRPLRGWRRFRQGRCR